MVKRIINTVFALFLLVGSVFSQEAITLDSDSACTIYADFIFKDSSTTENDFTYFFQAAFYKPEAGETIQYEWRFPDGSIVMDSIAVYTFPEEGYYNVFLMLTNNAGCSDSIFKKVPIYKELKPPNVFTPNGDMINDYFKVTTQGDYSYDFRVFTRTGTQVYFSHSPKITWDGKTIGGRDVPEGVYYFVIDSKETPAVTQVSGFIHLYR